MPLKHPKGKRVVIPDPFRSPILDVSIATHPCCRALLFLGVTQTNIAACLGLDPRTVASYISGRSRWPQKHIPRLCELLADAIQIAKKTYFNHSLETYLPYFSVRIYPVADEEEAAKIKTAVHKIVIGGMKDKVSFAKLVLHNFGEVGR